MKVRRFISFVVMLPTWPFAIVASIVDDKAEVADIVSCFIQTWMRIYEKQKQ